MAADNPDKKKKRKVASGATLYSAKPGEKRERKKPRDPEQMARASSLIKTLPDEEFIPQIMKHLTSSGIEVQQYKRAYIIRRLKARISRYKLSSYKEYLDLLRSNYAEIAELKESLSINVTRFFRNRDTFEEIRDSVLPAIVERVKSSGKKEIKIWSAGTAVGAEAYSVAMLASSIVPTNIRVKVMGTDIKDELLETARFATYTAPYLAEMTPVEISSYFNKNDFDEYTVKPEIRSKVSFSKLNLMKDNFPNHFDLVLCRNVLIYIDRDAQHDIISKFFTSLKSEGFLILGRTETLFTDWRDSVNIASTKHRIYQKKGGTAEFKAPRKRERLTKTDIKVETVKATTITKKNDRIEELKNFRKTFEERRRSWENRLDSSRRETETPRVSKETIDNRFERLGRTGSLLNKRFTAMNTPTKEKKIKPTSITPSLRNYREQLRKGTPTRESRIRRDPVQKKKEKIEKEMNPEDIYYRLKKRRETQEKEKKEKKKRVGFRY